MESRSEVHRQFSSTMTEDIVKPLKQLLDNQHKARKTVILLFACFFLLHSIKSIYIISFDFDAQFQLFSDLSFETD